MQESTKKITNALNPEDLEVGGFRFLTKADADKARVDEGKITYIKSNVSYTTASSLQAVYEKAISNRIFSTPVGWGFLRDLRGTLLDMGTDESKLPAIPMTAGFTKPVQTLEESSKPRIRREEKDAGKARVLMLSFALNIILAILVVIMFTVVYFGETNNIVNYKRNITNRYSAWEQELKDREELIRQKERELGIKPDTTTESGTQ